MIKKILKDILQEMLLGDESQQALTSNASTADIAAEMIGKKCMIRTYSAGVHFGCIEKRNGRECLLTNARRVHYWEGAASLSQLATEGTSKPDSCRISVAVDKILLTETIEIIPMTEKALDILEELKWKA